MSLMFFTGPDAEERKKFFHQKVDATHDRRRKKREKIIRLGRWKLTEENFKLITFLENICVSKIKCHGKPEFITI